MSPAAVTSDSTEENEENIAIQHSPSARKLCPHNTNISCASCRLNELCLPIALNKAEVHQLDEIVERNRPYKKGDHLYRQSDEFKSVYAVRSGSFKSYVLSDTGQGRVTGFFLPGEIIGMDGIASKHYANSTQALEHSSICEIPFSQLEKLSHQLPNLQHHFFAIMGNEIAKDQQIHTLLSSYTAEERTASFLLGLSSRYARVSLSPSRFLLPMTRSDIGEYLGLTVETVSRIFTALQRKRLIEVNNREIELLEIDTLREIIGVN
ncbi:MAG TPA: Crp/Fnr family transcriptional regulator [Gammaproteobacteria bacterium]|jgi:CRP/FNR family transcriptional regulator|nr:fumarate/nitrate reduction transcriptional regulator Fnr [Gammaproteobacteria bacterium]MDP6732439.1 fumarate/nitrate reduction transcriptional regulator Fnr [Gammaproteobacteria bacterium]HAJ76176.1 Crp/Fnr family transcriptional regulator [Gammaproteobacteria bacterium]